MRTKPIPPPYHRVEVWENKILAPSEWRDGCQIIMCCPTKESRNEYLSNFTAVEMLKARYIVEVFDKSGELVEKLFTNDDPPKEPNG